MDGSEDENDEVWEALGFMINNILLIIQVRWSKMENRQIHVSWRNPKRKLNAKHTFTEGMEEVECYLSKGGVYLSRGFPFSGMFPFCFRRVEDSVSRT